MKVTTEIKAAQIQNIQNELTNCTQHGVGNCPSVLKTMGFRYSNSKWFKMILSRLSSVGPTQNGDRWNARITLARPDPTPPCSLPHKFQQRTCTNWQNKTYQENKWSAVHKQFKSHTPLSCRVGLAGCRNAKERQNKLCTRPTLDRLTIIPLENLAAASQSFRCHHLFNPAAFPSLSSTEAKLP